MNGRKPSNEHLKTGSDPKGDPPVARAAEQVPYRYNVRSELTATVDRGKNLLNFHLDSHGPIAQPDIPRAILR